MQLQYVLDIRRVHNSFWAVIILVNCNSSTNFILDFDNFILIIMLDTLGESVFSGKQEGLQNELHIVSTLSILLLLFFLFHELCSFHLFLIITIIIYLKVAFILCMFDCLDICFIKYWINMQGKMSYSFFTYCCIVWLYGNAFWYMYNVSYNVFSSDIFSSFEMKCNMRYQLQFSMKNSALTDDFS